MPASQNRVDASVSDEFTVFVVDADQSFSDSMTLVLGYRGYGLRHFVRPEDFLAARKPGWRGCVLASLDLPGQSALALLESGGLPVVFMTTTGELSQVRAAFIAGAVDVLPKPVVVEELMASLDRAIGIARQQVALVSQPRRPSAANGLSRREAEVAALVRQGYGNRNIAEQLGISHRTVEVHKTRLMRKLGAGSLAELIALPEPVASKRRARNARLRKPD